MNQNAVVPTISISTISAIHSLHPFTAAPHPSFYRRTTPNTSFRLATPRCW